MMGKTDIRHAMAEHNRLPQPIRQLGCNPRTKHDICQSVKLAAFPKSQRLPIGVLVASKKLLSGPNNTKAAMRVSKRNGHRPGYVFLRFNLLQRSPGNVRRCSANAEHREQQQVYFTGSRSNNQIHAADRTGEPVTRLLPDMLYTEQHKNTDCNRHHG